MIAVLRPTRTSRLISADVFDALFMQHLKEALSITRVEMVEWCQRIFGEEDAPVSLQQAEDNFRRTVDGYDYFCPGCELIPFAHIFMALRNNSRSNIRLLLIAHAPGAYGMEWARLRPLLLGNPDPHLDAQTFDDDRIFHRDITVSNKTRVGRFKSMRPASSVVAQQNSSASSLSRTSPALASAV